MKYFIVFSVILANYLLYPNYVNAEYVATGSFEVTSCKGFVIHVCGPVIIDAVDHDGKMYSMKKVWSEVDSYSNGTCYLNLVGKSAIPFLHKAMNPTFYHYDESGQLKKIKNIEGRVFFPCKKQ